MRRSCLFIPGNQPSMLQNADVFAADSIILDLEDAVSEEDKDAARMLVKLFLESFNLHSKEVMVRINGLDTPHAYLDLEAIIMDQLDAIVLPKATKESTEQLIEWMMKIKEKKKLIKCFKVIPIIELAVSVLEVEQIASILGVDGLLLGAEDLANDMEIERSELGTEIIYARSIISLVATKYHLDAIDTPYINIHDEQGLIEDALRAKNIGMKAKACIHPNQIDVVNEVFSPSQVQIAQAVRLLEAVKQHEGRGAFQLDGKMVDKPIIERSKKIIQKAIKFGLLREKS